MQITMIFCVYLNYTNLSIYVIISRVPIENDRTESYLQALRTEIDKDKPQIVVTIVTSNRKDRYDAIKKLCCLEKPGKDP